MFLIANIRYYIREKFQPYSPNYYNKSLLKLYKYLQIYSNRFDGPIIIKLVVKLKSKPVHTKSYTAWGSYVVVQC